MRILRIATVSFLIEDRPHTVDENLVKAQEYISEAVRNSADIVCLPELFVTANIGSIPDQITAQPADIASIMSGYASVSGLYIVAPFLVREKRNWYNQAVIFTPDGNLAGRYRKVQPTAYELKHVRAGTELPVFDLPFGRVAVQICMDMHFPEIARIYGLKGAEIVFWPTSTHGPTQESLETQIRARAIDNSLIMVEANYACNPPYAPYAGRYQPGNARIIDHNGDVLAQTGRRDGVAIAEVDLDEARKTSGCVLFREPDHIKDDLRRLGNFRLYADEYATIAAQNNPSAKRKKT